MIQRPLFFPLVPRLPSEPVVSLSSFRSISLPAPWSELEAAAGPTSTAPDDFILSSFLCSSVDLTHTGVEELVVADRQSGIVYQLTRDNTGFSRIEISNRTGADWRDVAVGDLEGDGDKEISLPLEAYMLSRSISTTAVTRIEVVTCVIKSITNIIQRLQFRLERFYTLTKIHQSERDPLQARPALPNTP